MKHIFFLLALGIPLTSFCFAQWSLDPSINTPIATPTRDQHNPQIAGDGNGGAIITWTDNRNFNADIYAQRINAKSEMSWTSNGIGICTNGSTQGYPVIVGDGSGGAIIVWADRRNGKGDLYAQRIDSAGVTKWTADGVPVCIAPGDRFVYSIISDGQGGAIISWEDGRSGSGRDIYAERIDSYGFPEWTVNGTPICTATGEQHFATIASDGAGGAMITWEDDRNSATSSDIYAQRITVNGVVLWAANGVPICTAANVQENPTIATDGAGGAVIAWSDFRSGVDRDIYAQRIPANGAVLWSANGVPTCTATGDQRYPKIVSDDAGGAIVIWHQPSANIYYHVSAQRINSAGVVQWNANGVSIHTMPSRGGMTSVTNDGAGGAIIAWSDERMLNAPSPDTGNVYAQRINSSGEVQWVLSGAAISIASGKQLFPSLICNGAGNAFITWEDERNGGFVQSDIYVQRIHISGFLEDPSPRDISILDVPHDQGGRVRLSWSKSPLDSSVITPISSYGIWRKIPPSIAAKIAHRAVSPLSVLNDTLGAMYDFVMSVPAVQSHQYHAVVETLEDSCASGTHDFTFLITAHTALYPSMYGISEADSGHSVDNLSPSAVATVVAQVESNQNINVHWTKDMVDPDVGVYEVYRSTAHGFTPSPSTMIGQTSDTLLVDGSPVGGVSNYYRIVTVDVHGNKSQPSPEALAGATSTQMLSLSDKWNLVSVPLTPSDYSKSSLYPTAVSQAFAYEGVYVVKSTLVNGVGYWLKFSGAQSVSMTGFLRAADTIAVTKGWNLIGSISSPLATSHLTSIPSGIATSQFFGYQGNYAVSNTIEPGKAYWVKVNQNGKLVLSSSSAEVQASSGIRIVPTSERPPSAPDGVQSDRGTAPTEYALEQNYPNPFNPTTVISFELPVSSYVTLKVYNMLGQEVATLIDGAQDAGMKSVTFDAAHLPSGVYTYRVSAGSFSDVKRMSLVK